MDVQLLFYLLFVRCYVGEFGCGNAKVVDQCNLVKQLMITSALDALPLFGSQIDYMLGRYFPILVLFSLDNPHHEIAVWHV